MVERRCPKCKEKNGSFVVYGSGRCEVSIYMNTDGTLDDWEYNGVCDDDFDYDDNSWAQCRECDHEEEWGAFDITDQEPDEDDDSEEKIDGLEDDVSEIERKTVDEMLSYIDKRLKGS